MHQRAGHSSYHRKQISDGQHQQRYYTSQDFPQTNQPDSITKFQFQSRSNGYCVKSGSSKRDVDVSTMEDTIGQLDRRLLLCQDEARKFQATLLEARDKKDERVADIEADLGDVHRQIAEIQNNIDAKLSQWTSRIDEARQLAAGNKNYTDEKVLKAYSLCQIMMSRFEDVHAQISEFEKHNDQYVLKINRRAEEMSIDQECLQTLSEQVTKAEANLHDVKRQSEEKYHALDARINELNSQLQDETRNIAVKTRLVGLEKHIQGLTLKPDGLEDVLIRREQEHPHTALKQVQEENVKIASRVSQLESSVRPLNGLAEEVKTAQDVRNADLSSWLESQLSQDRHSISELKASIQDIRSIQDRSATKLQGLGDSLSRLEKENLPATLNQVQEENEKVAARVSQLESSVRPLKGLAEEVKTAQDAQKADLSSWLESQLGQDRHSISELQASVQDINNIQDQNVAELQGLVDALSRLEKESLPSTLDQVQEENEKVAARVSQIESSIPPLRGLAEEMKIFQAAQEVRNADLSSLQLQSDQTRDHISLLQYRQDESATTLQGLRDEIGRYQRIQETLHSDLTRTCGSNLEGLTNTTNTLKIHDADISFLKQQWQSLQSKTPTDGVSSFFGYKCVTVEAFTEKTSYADNELRAMRRELSDLREMSPTQNDTSISELANLERKVMAEIHSIRNEVSDLRDMTRLSAGDVKPSENRNSASSSLDSDSNGVEEQESTVRVADQAMASPTREDKSRAITSLPVTTTPPERSDHDVQSSSPERSDPCRLQDEECPTCSMAESEFSPGDLQQPQTTPRSISKAPQTPFFTRPPHPDDEHSRRITLALEQEILRALQSAASMEEKRKLVLRQMPLKVHPDKGGSENACDWLEKWKEAHFEWFLSNGKK